MPLFNSWSYTFLCLAVALIAINQFLLFAMLVAWVFEGDWFDD